MPKIGNLDTTIINPQINEHYTVEKEGQEDLKKEINRLRQLEKSGKKIAKFPEIERRPLTVRDVLAETFSMPLSVVFQVKDGEERPYKPNIEYSVGAFIARLWEAKKNVNVKSQDVYDFLKIVYEKNPTQFHAFAWGKAGKLSGLLAEGYNDDFDVDEDVDEPKQETEPVEKIEEIDAQS